MTTRKPVLTAAALAAALLASPGLAFAQGDAAKGKAIYDAANPKCKMCHSVAGDGNAKGALDDVGSKLKADEIKAWLRDAKGMTAKTKATRKPAMPDYPAAKISDADLENLVAYLASLKKK